jgi:hypothetical protein
MLDAVLNFDMSHLKILPLILVVLTGLPMLQAYVRDRELTWWPPLALLAVLGLVVVINAFIPGFTNERPRGMSLVYVENEDSATGQLVLESAYRHHDRKYAKGHGFEMAEVDSGRPEPVERPVREAPRLGLPGLTMTMQGFQTDDGKGRRRLNLDVPAGIPFVQLILPRESQLEQAWVNGVLALDTTIENKHQRTVDRLAVIYPDAGTLSVELLTGSLDPVRVAAVTWHELPELLTAPFMGNWPEDSQPLFVGPRAIKVQRFDLTAGAAGE